MSVCPEGSIPAQRDEQRSKEAPVPGANQPCPGAPVVLSERRGEAVSQHWRCFSSPRNDPGKGKICAWSAELE